MQQISLNPSIQMRETKKDGNPDYHQYQVSNVFVFSNTIIPCTIN